MSETRPRYKDLNETETSLDDDEWLRLVKKKNIEFDEKNLTMQMN